MKTAVPGAETESKPSSALEMLGQDPSSFFPFWPSAYLYRSAGQRSSRSSIHPKLLPACWWAFFCKQKVQCQTISGRSPGNPIAGTAVLGWLGQALTLWGHCTSAPSSLGKVCPLTLGSASVGTTLTRLQRLGTDLGCPEGPLGTLHCVVSVQEQKEGISQGSHPLLGRCRAQGTQRETEIFVPICFHIWGKKDKHLAAFSSFSILSRCSHARRNTCSSFS